MTFYDIAQSLSPCFILCTLYLFFRLKKIENLFIIYKKKQDDELAFISQELKSMPGYNRPETSISQNNYQTKAGE